MRLGWRSGEGLSCRLRLARYRSDHIGLGRSGLWSAHFVLGVVLALLIVSFFAWRRSKANRLPLEDPDLLHRVAIATHVSLYLLLSLLVGLGIASTFVRRVHLIGRISLPQLGDPTWRQPLLELQETRRSSARSRHRIRGSRSQHDRPPNRGCPRGSCTDPRAIAAVADASEHLS